MRQRIISGTIAAIGALILSACATLPGGGSAELSPALSAPVVSDSVTGENGGAVQADVAVADLAAAKKWCGSKCNGRTAGSLISGFGKCSADARILDSGTLRPGWPKGEGAPVRAGIADPYIAVTVYYSPKCETIWTKVFNKKATGRTSCTVALRSFTSPYDIVVGCPRAGSSVTTRMVDAHRVGGRSGAYTIVAALDSRNRESSFLVQR